jgi:hypothetical protein
VGECSRRNLKQFFQEEEKQTLVNGKLLSKGDMSMEIEHESF